MAMVLCVLYDDPIEIVDGGKLAGTGAHAYSAGDSTGGSEKTAR